MSTVVACTNAGLAIVSYWGILFLNPDPLDPDPLDPTAEKQRQLVAKIWLHIGALCPSWLCVESSNEYIFLPVYNNRL